MTTTADTAYDKIPTTDLTAGTFVYLEKAEYVLDILRLPNVTIVHTSYDTYRIPADEADRPMWRVLL